MRNVPQRTAGGAWCRLGSGPRRQVRDGLEEDELVEFCSDTVIYYWGEPCVILEADLLIVTVPPHCDRAYAGPAPPACDLPSLPAKMCRRGRPGVILEADPVADRHAGRRLQGVPETWLKGLRRVDVMVPYLKLFSGRTPSRFGPKAPLEFVLAPHSL